MVMGSLAGCDSQEMQQAFEDDANVPPEGITRTDGGGGLVLRDNGEPVSEDLDDWRTAPLYAGTIRFDPAYPNPTFTDLITLPFVVQQFDALPGGLAVRGFDNTGRFVLLDEAFDATQPGSYAFIFSPSLLSGSGDVTSIRGLHRIFVVDTQGTLVTYGDIQIQ